MSAARTLIVLLVLASPLFWVAFRNNKSAVARKFAFWAIALTVLITGIELTSRGLVGRCLDVGNTQCVDYGGTGAQFLIISAFAVVSWIRARAIVRPF